MANYSELRAKAFNGTPRGLSFEILATNNHLVFHPSVNPKGTKAHYTIYNDESAVCCPANEAMLLYQIAEYLNPEIFIEVGSYAGWSSCHILAAMTPGNSFIAVDNFEECKSPSLVRDILHKQLIPYRDSYLYECDSTEFLNDCVVLADAIFIDGFHRDGKPLQDVKASMNSLSPNGVLILHDVWMPDVKIAHDWLIEQGFNFHQFETDNLLTVYSKEGLLWCKTLVQ